MSNFTTSLKEDLIHYKVKDLSNDGIYDLIDENDEKLDEYKYGRNWLYQTWFWRDIKDIEDENDLLHRIIVERMIDSQLKTPL